MMELRDWQVVRSGAKLTVTGKGYDGAPGKLTNVDRVFRDGGQTIALRGGERFLLS